MKDVIYIDDDYGAYVRLETVPSLAPGTPQLINILVRDDSMAMAELNIEQALALRDALTDLLG